MEAEVVADGGRKGEAEAAVMVATEVERSGVGAADEGAKEEEEEKRSGSSSDSSLETSVSN